MDDEKATQNDAVKTNELLLKDLPVNEDESEDIQAGAGASLQLNSSLTVASESLRL